MTCSQLLFRSIRSFIKDRGSMFAASMSFYAIMSIVPFCLILITLTGFIMGEKPELQDFIISKILESFPDVTRDITNEFVKLISYKGIGIFSFVLYAYLSFQLLKSADFALNAILNNSSRRAIHRSILLSFGIITFIIIIFLSSFSAATIAVAPPFLEQYIPAFEIGILAAVIIRFVVPFVLAWLIIALLYIILPINRPRALHALKAAFFVSTLLELAKHVFTWYIGNVSRLGHIYGPLTAFIIFLLWVYYSSCIFLIGAEMIKTLRDYKEDEVYEPSYW